MTKRGKPSLEKQDRFIGIPTATVLSPQERETFEKIAAQEHRTLSGQLAHALGEWLHLRVFGDKPPAPKATDSE